MTITHQPLAPTVITPDLCSHALEYIENGVLLLDRQQKVIFWNQWLVRYSGIAADHALGKSLAQIFSAPLPQILLTSIQDACEQGLSRILSHQLHGQLLPLHNDISSSPVFHSLVLRAIRQSDGMVLMQVHNISNAVRRERHLRDKERALRKAHKTQLEKKQFINTVLETISALVVVTDLDGNIVSMNQSAEQYTGFNEAELKGQPLKMLLGLDSFKYLSASSAQTNKQRSFTCRMTNAAAEPIHVRWTVKPVAEGEGALEYLIYTGQDVTERERADALLRLEREMLEMAAGNEPADHILNHACLTLERQLESCRVAVVQVGSDHRLHVRNGPGLPEMFGEQLHQLQSERLLRVLHTKLERDQLHVFPMRAQGERWQQWLVLAKEYKMAGCWLMPIQSSPSLMRTLLAVFPRYKSHPCEHEKMLVQRIGYLTALILERQQQQEQIEKLALYDSLTGLANRSLLNEQLQRAICRSVREHQAFALLFIDLNGFKAVNDTHGHDAGDALLVALGERLKMRFRATDCCARIGGDEFVILLDDIKHQQFAFRIAESLLSLIAEPLTWGEHQLQVTASIGIALYPEDAETAAALLTRADNAMYRAKAESKIIAQGCVTRLSAGE